MAAYTGQHDQLDFLLRVFGARCWEWPKERDPCGYGRMGWKGKVEFVHRVAYEMFKGPIPEGLEIDHLCSNRACFNPDHLEAVSRTENNRRKRRLLPGGECGNGHHLHDGNYRVEPSGRLACRECIRNAQRRYQARRRARSAGVAA